MLSFLLLMVGTLNAQTTEWRPAEDSHAYRQFKAANRAYNQRNLRMAINKYRKAAELYPNFVEAYDNLGLCYRHLQVPDSSELWLKKSIEVDPNGTVSRQRLGVLYTKQKSYRKALRQYNELMELHPRNPEGFFGAAKVQLIQGDYEIASRNAAKALEIYRKDNAPYMADASFLLGMIYFYQDDYGKARDYLGEAEKLGKEIPPPLREKVGL